MLSAICVSIWIIQIRHNRHLRVYRVSCESLERLHHDNLDYWTTYLRVFVTNSRFILSNCLLITLIYYLTYIVCINNLWMDTAAYDVIYRIITREFMQKWRILSKTPFRYLNEYDRVLKLPETEKRMYPLKDMMRDLTNLTGKNIEKPIDIFYLYHTFVAESSMGLPLPKWAHNYFPYGELFHGIVTSYNISNSNILLKRLFAGKIHISISFSLKYNSEIFVEILLLKYYWNYIYPNHVNNCAYNMLTAMYYKSN